MGDGSHLPARLPARSFFCACVGWPCRACVHLSGVYADTLTRTCMLALHLETHLKRLRLCYSLTAPLTICPASLPALTISQSLAGQYGVKGFPTIKLFGSDKKSPKDYQGQRDVNGLAQAAVQLAAETVQTRQARATLWRCKNVPPRCLCSCSAGLYSTASNRTKAATESLSQARLVSTSSQAHQIQLAGKCPRLAHCHPSVSTHQQLSLSPGQQRLFSALATAMICSTTQRCVSWAPPLGLAVAAVGVMAAVVAAAAQSSS
jgi:hypothetical protein